MDSSEKFYLSLWAIICATLVTLVALTAVYNAERRAVWLEAIEKGATPLQATCALYDINSQAEAIMCFNAFKTVKE